MAGALEIAVWLLLVGASVTDILWGKIHNALTLPFLATGVAIRVFSSGIEGFELSLLSIGSALLVFLPLYFSQVMAAGDVKLLMAAAAFLNPSQTFKLAGFTVLIGALAGLGILLYRRMVQKTSGKTRIPFAPAFLCAFSFLNIAETRGWTL